MIGKYLRLLTGRMYFGVMVILACACLGSVRGAMKESREPFIGVTEADMDRMQDGVAGPDLTGIMPLAAEQNRWRNFSYAVIYAGRGLVIYCVLMAVYLPLYRLRCLQVLRSFLRKETAEETLFLSPGEEDGGW